MSEGTEQLVDRLLDRAGTTYAQEAGIHLADKPSALYELLVLAHLLSARIGADIAVAAARELFAAGYRTPKAMIEAGWQERVDALGRGHYRRYDERTASQLGDGAQLLTDRWHGDLRRLHEEAGGDVDRLRELLQEFPGIGPTGADIYCREVRGVWPDVRPFVDGRALDGARSLGLPAKADRIVDLVAAEDLPRLVAGCVRASLSQALVDELTGA